MQLKRAHSSSDAANSGNSRCAKRQKPDESVPHRSQLPSPTSSPSPLTFANLRTHDMIVSRSQSSRKRKSQSPEKAADSRSVFEAHNILILQKKPLPPDISSLVQRLRNDSDGRDRSAEVKNIMRISPIAAIANERDGKRLLERQLFYEEAIQGGRAGLAITEDQNMAKRMLPPSASLIARGGLKTPQVDTVVGYVRNEMITIYNNVAGQQQEGGLLRSVFSEEEAEAAAMTRIVDGVNLPWFSCQWKARKNGGTHKAAEEQGARDGSAILNYNHKLLTLADFDREAPISPAAEATAASTVHFSSTIDLQTVNMYVHWIDFGDPPARARYRMERIFVKDLEDEQSMAELRVFMDNLYDWAMGDRLSTFKEALGRRYRQLAAHPETAMADPDDDEASSQQTLPSASVSEMWPSGRMRGFASLSEGSGVEAEERITKRR